MTKGIIFDLGHTLMEFHGHWDDVEEQGKKLMLKFLAKRDANVPPEFAQLFFEKREEGIAKSDASLVEYTAEQAFKDALKALSLNGKIESLIPGALEAFFTPEEENWKAYPDAAETLHELRNQGYKLAILSNATDHAFIMRCINKLELENLLDVIVTSAGFGSRKPNPQIFHSIANEWGIKPESIAMVGDQLYFDVFGAHQAGMMGIWIERNAMKAHTYIPQELVNHPLLIPDNTIRELSDIPGILN